MCPATWDGGRGCKGGGGVVRGGGKEEDNVIAEQTVCTMRSWTLYVLIWTHARACTHTRTHTLSFHIHMRALRKHVHTQTHTRTRGRAHAHTHATHTHTHRRTHAHTHTAYRKIGTSPQRTGHYFNWTKPDATTLADKYKIYKVHRVNVQTNGLASNRHPKSDTRQSKDTNTTAYNQTPTQTDNTLSPNTLQTDTRRRTSNNENTNNLVLVQPIPSRWTSTQTETKQNRDTTDKHSTGPLWTDLGVGAVDV